MGSPLRQEGLHVRFESRDARFCVRHFCLFVAAAHAYAADPASHALALTHVPAAVANGSAKRIAALPASQRMKLAINLPLRDEAGLHAFVRAVYDPASPSYRKYLSVAEFTERFGPSEADYDAVVAWAIGQGFTMLRVARAIATSSMSKGP